VRADRRVPAPKSFPKKGAFAGGKLYKGLFTKNNLMDKGVMPQAEIFLVIEATPISVDTITLVFRGNQRLLLPARPETTAPDVKEFAGRKRVRRA